MPAERPAFFAMRVKDIELDNPFILAPLAGVTDIPFRTLCKRMGAALTVTEMVSAKGMLYGSEATLNLLKTDPSERPRAAQLFGSDPKIVARGVREVQDMGFDLVDINMGCPAPKIVKNGEGSALMKDVRLAAQIVEAAAKAVPVVTVKFRKGWDDASVNGVEFAKAMEEAGAAAVTVHGRTREQQYSGRADWPFIGRVKAALHIPVIGNGDVFSAEDGMAMLKETECDGVMIARGAMGNPFIFREAVHLWKTGTPLAPPTLEERVSAAREHLRRLADMKGERIAVREMRKHLCWYLKGVKHVSALRRDVHEAATVQQMECILDRTLEA